MHKNAWLVGSGEVAHGGGMVRIRGGAGEGSRFKAMRTRDEALCFVTERERQPSRGTGSPGRSHRHLGKLVLKCIIPQLFLRLSWASVSPET